MTSTMPELDIFAARQENISLLEGYYTSYRPISVLTGSGPIDFLVQNDVSDDPIDLFNSNLYIKCQIVRQEGGAPILEADELTVANSKFEVAPTNNLFSSLFSSAQCKLNEVQISSSLDQYAYRSYLEKIINFTGEAKNTKLSSEGFVVDTPGQFDSLLPAENSGLKTRIKWGKDIIHLQGRPSLDIFCQQKYLIPGVNLRLKFIRSKASFCLQAPTGNTGFHINILDAILYLRKVKVHDNIIVAHNRTLAGGADALYNIQRIDIKNYSIPTGLKSYRIDNIHLGRLPDRIVMGLVLNSSESGEYHTNPFNFQFFDLNGLSLQVNERLVPSTPLRPEEDGFLGMYLTLFNNNINQNPHSNGLSLTQYKQGGNAICIFNLAHDLADSSDENDLLPTYRSGTVNMNLSFSKSTPATLSLILYSEFSDTIKINSNRQVTLDYA